ncbi:MAG: cobalt transporter CbiM [Dethiobacteria bacterium]|jgi:cobalt/nickel transport system permease protein
MHIPDGIISVSAAVGGYAVTGGMTWLSLHKIKKQYGNPRNVIPKAALLTAAFFVASLIHIPVPPVSVHLVLSGLMGVMLGWFAFPAVLVGLLLQAIMFQHGGLTTLGVNACLMGLPALLAHRLFSLRRFFGLQKPLPNGLLAFLASFTAVVAGAMIAALLLIYVAPASASFDAAAEKAAVLTLSLAHLPVALLEGVFTAMVVLFLLRVQPALLEVDPK